MSQHSQHFQPWKKNTISTIQQNNYGKIQSHTLLSPQQQQQQTTTAETPAAATLLPQPQLPTIAAATTPTITSTSISNQPIQSTSNEFFRQMNMNTLNKLNINYEFGNSSIEDNNNEERNAKLHEVIENTISDNVKEQILQILKSVSQLKPPERLLLYLRLPNGSPEIDPLRQSQNPLGTRSEINYTINWVRSHLEHDPNVSIPKQEVYDDYTAYCARVDIKPLSTADFGKVMKQVFPGIRPRRLGTRGHSRYCYAAMRKATKLDTPKLPDIGRKVDVPEEDSLENEEESWKIVKQWAEGMLSTAFGGINDLAGFIIKNNLNSPSSIHSRQLIHKKLMQRELKEKKKINNAALKKRRKKRRKTLSTSLETLVNPIVEINPDTAQENMNKVNALIKNELNIDEDDNVNMIGKNMATTTNSNHNSINALINQQQQTSSNDQPILPTSSNLNLNTINNIINNTNSNNINNDVKNEDNEHGNIICKKVRQAQQAKLLSAAKLNMINLQNAQTHSSQSTIASVTPSSTVNNSNINLINDKICMPPSTSKRMLNTINRNRLKRLKLQQLQRQSPQNTPRYDDMGNLIMLEPNDLMLKNEDSDFVLSRERLISISNMDKTALDDYLNCEDNSQEQDEEILQYFPEEEQQKQFNAKNATGSASVPILENYHLYNQENNEKLSQLRSMLEQNMQNVCNSANNSNAINLVDKQASGINQQSPNQNAENLSQMNLYPCSASASLAMLSQRHHIATNNSNSISNFKNLTGNAARKLNLDLPYNNNNSNNSNVNNTNNNENFSNCAMVNNVNSIIANNNSVLQSPNARRKNYNFVPIGGPQSKLHHQQLNNHNNNNANASPFVSPRNTPIHHKRLSNNKAPVLNLTILEQKFNPNNNFTRPYIKSEFPASAPPSPSLVQSFRFGCSNNNNNHNLNNSINTNSGPFTPISPQISTNPSSINCPTNDQARSSSVPLIPNCSNYYQSNYSSVSQTPVPTEYNDFSDPTTILEMLDDSNDMHSAPIKMEESELISELLNPENELFSNKTNFNSISKSVPSTPLPTLGYNSNSNSINMNENVNHNPNRKPIRIMIYIFIHIY
uniref:Putative regulation of transcription dna-dependent n=1 Tax=Corethrella appendiculata TaxID=1370023 RepID=U5EUU6_9DIPT